MADLEQTARRACNLAPTEQLSWMLPRLDADLYFARWLPTQAFSWPGAADRRCDTVAELRSRTGRQRSWAVIVEVEASPRRARIERVQEYELLLRRDLRHGPRKQDRYCVTSVVLILTGTFRHWHLHERLPGTRLGTVWRGSVVCIGDHDAEQTLAQISVGNLGRSVLVWVPLMRGADQPTVVQRWVELARTESNEDRRAEYAPLAQIFAERAGCLPVWKPQLEGWEMWKSQVIAGWKNSGIDDGVLRERQQTLLWLIKERFPEAPMAEVETAICAQTDVNLLLNWRNLIIKTDSFGAICQALKI
jgi:hypothetical protein